MKLFAHSFQRQDSGTQHRTLWQLFHLDLPLLIGIFFLVTFGFFVLYSASNQQIGMVEQEVLHIGLAAVLMLLIAQIPPYVYERWSPFLYSIALFLMVVVLIVGRIDKGAQRWLNLGIIRFQPSELMKISIPMALSYYFAHRPLPPSLKNILIACFMMIIPAILAAKEPDLGTAIVLILSGVCVLLLAGLSWRLILSAAALIGASTPVLWHFLHGYQRERILTFFNPERDPLGAGYHIIQSKIAIGSGGFFGKGWLMGTQSHLHFLPEHATDFIFAVCGEELGLIGCSVLILIYLFITICAFRIANRAQDTYTRLLAGSIGLIFFISVFVNIGMVSGILPVVGLPLPLISYGGSSMITLMASFGILMSIQTHRKLWSK